MINRIKMYEIHSNPDLNNGKASTKSLLHHYSPRGVDSFLKNGLYFWFAHINYSHLQNTNVRAMSNIEKFLHLESVELSTFKIDWSFHFEFSEKIPNFSSNSG